MLLLLLNQSAAASPETGVVVVQPVRRVMPALMPADVLERVKKLIPKRWFSWAATYRDAIIGGLSDSASWSYGLIAYAQSQTRLLTAYGIWLDIFAYDFLGRALTRSKLEDDAFRVLIRATILQERVTRSGMSTAITAMTGKVPFIFEPWNTFDTGAYSSPGGVKYGSMGYNVGQGGYGNMNLPGQVFIKVSRTAGSGIPNVDGYGNTIAGYGSGAIEYLGPGSELSGITNDMIYKMISTTKPTGTTAWVAFQAPVRGLITEGGARLVDDSGNRLLTG